MSDMVYSTAPGKPFEGVKPDNRKKKNLKNKG